MSNVQLPGSKRFGYHIYMHTSTPNNDVSLAKESQEHMSKERLKMVPFRANTKKDSLK